MSPPSRPEEHADAEQNGYPRLDEATISSVNAKIEEIIVRLHGGSLTDLQKQEMRLSLASQSKTSEVLHRFVLRNSDEPAFIFHAV